MIKHTSLTGADLIDWLRHKSGWKTRVVPGVEISVESHLFHDAIDEIERLTAERDLALANADGVYAKLMAAIERMAAPIGMPDVRLVTGEGTLHAADVLKAVNVVLKSRARL